MSTEVSKQNRTKNKHQIIQDLELSGLNNDEIARVVGMSANWVSLVRSSTLYQAGLQKRLAQQNRETANLIQSLAMENVMRIRDIARYSKNEKVALSAARWIAENAGFKAPEKTEIAVNLLEVVEQARALAESRRTVVHVEAEEAGETGEISEIQEIEGVQEALAIEYKSEAGRKDPLDILVELNQELRENNV